MQDNLIKDNKGTAIRIIVGGYEVAGWDEASFDSAIDIPADAFSVTYLTLFMTICLKL
jgi:prophage tail gpP-like protein